MNDFPVIAARFAGRVAGTAVRRFRETDWVTIADRTAEYALIAWALLQILTAFVVIAAEYVWENREEIQDAAYAAIAATVEKAEEVYATGQEFRQWLEGVSEEVANTAATIPAPFAPVAPIAGPFLMLFRALTPAV
jgi:hypothetical protein